MRLDSQEVAPPPEGAVVAPSIPTVTVPPDGARLATVGIAMMPSSRDLAYHQEKQERQAETDKALEVLRSSAEMHKREQEGRAEADKAEAQRDLIERAIDAAKARGKSFKTPDVPGRGWASTEVGRVLDTAARRAEALFNELIAAERDVEHARQRIGNATNSSILVRPARDLASAREAADICDARFEAAYAELERQRARLTDSEYLATIEQLNAAAQSAFFKPYVTREDPEMAQIRAATRTLFDAFDAISRRHEAKIQEHAAASTLARSLGVPSKQLRDLAQGQRILDRGAARVIVKGVILEETKAWQQRNGEAAVTEWLPDFDSPWG